MAIHPIKEQYQPHPFASLTVLADGKPLMELRDDIKRNGLLDAIILYEGMILDGRRRYKACLMADVEPRFETFEGTKEKALSFTVSKNTRRNLGEYDRIQYAAAVAKEYARLAAERQKAGVKVPEGSPKGKASELASKDTGVKVDKIEQMQTVNDHGTPAVQEALKKEKMSLSVAADIARESPEKQEEVMEKVKKKATPRKALKEVKQEKTEWDAREFESLIGKQLSRLEDFKRINGAGTDHKALVEAVENLSVVFQGWKKSNQKK